MPLSDLGTPAQLIKRYKTARKEYDDFRSLHEDTYDYVAPDKNTFSNKTKGGVRNVHVYDSTACLGAEIFASRIRAAVIPSWKQWIELTAGEDVPEEAKIKINQELTKRTKILFNALNHSNFYTEINPALIDLAVGTGGIIIDEGDFATGKAFNFTNVPLVQLVPEKPASGRINSAWRTHKMAAGKIAQVYKGAKLPEKMAEAAKKSPEEEVELLTGELYNPKNGKYYHIVMCEKEKAVLYEHAHNTQRFIVFRWSVTPDETYGRGPAIHLLPDIKTLNKIVQFELEALALAVGGIYTAVNDGIFNPNTVQLRPKTIIPVATNNSQNPSLTPLAQGGNAGAVNLKVRELQDRINKAFFANALGEVTDPVRTATENMIRQQEMLKQAGASFGRLRSELQEPLIAAALDILAGLGELPEVLVVDGKSATLKHTSPQAKSEDLEDFQNFQTWAGTNIELVGPQVFQGTAKVENFPSATAEMLGVSADLVRTREETMEFGKAAAAAAQQQLATEQDPNVG